MYINIWIIVFGLISTRWKQISVITQTKKNKSVVELLLLLDKMGAQTLNVS